VCLSHGIQLCKNKKGSFKDTLPEDMLAGLFKGIVAKTGVDPSLIEDAQIGNVLQPGAGAVTARLGQLMGGCPANASV